MTKPQRVTNLSPVLFSYFPQSSPAPGDRHCPFLRYTLSMPLTSPTQVEQVLVVSNYPIFAQALVRLAREAGCQVIASVAKLDQALNILQPDMRATVIVDCQDIQPRQEEWLPLLEQASMARRIILLSLNRNEMIVHEQRRVTQVNENDLKQALAGANLPLEHSQPIRQLEPNHKASAHKRKIVRATLKNYQIPKTKKGE